MILNQNILAGPGTGARIIDFQEQIGHCVDPTADPKGFFNHSLPKKVGVDCNVNCKTFTSPTWLKSATPFADIMQNDDVVECSKRRQNFEEFTGRCVNVALDPLVPLAPAPLVNTPKDWGNAVTSELLCAEECYKQRGCNAYQWNGTRCVTYTEPHSLTRTNAMHGDGETGFRCHALRQQYNQPVDGVCVMQNVLLGPPTQTAQDAATIDTLEKCEIACSTTLDCSAFHFLTTSSTCTLSIQPRVDVVQSHTIYNTELKCQEDCDRQDQCLDYTFDAAALDPTQICIYHNTPLPMKGDGVAADTKCYTNNRNKIHDQCMRTQQLGADNSVGTECMTRQKPFKSEQGRCIGPYQAQLLSAGVWADVSGPGKTENDCANKCRAIDACTGYQWGSINLLCQTFDTTNLISSDGTTDSEYSCGFYEPQMKKEAGACVRKGTGVQNINDRTVNLASSEQQCKGNCLSQYPTCVAYEFDSLASQCVLHTTTEEYKGDGVTANTNCFTFKQDQSFATNGGKCANVDATDITLPFVVDQGFQAAPKDCAALCTDQSCTGYEYTTQEKACKETPISEEACTFLCKLDSKCTAIEYNTSGTGHCTHWYVGGLEWDGVANDNYDCRIKTITLEVTWYDEPWKHWVRIYMFDLAKVFGDAVEALMFKYFLKYGFGFLMGHDF